MKKKNCRFRNRENMWWARPISGKFIQAVVLAMALSNAFLNLDFSFWDKRVTLFLTLFLFPCFLHSALGSEKKRFGQFEFLPILSTNCEVRTGSANIEFFYPNCLSYNSTGLQFAKCKWRIAIFVVVVPFRHIVQAHQNESVWKSEKQKLSELESLV